MRLALIRHGPTEWNEAGRLQGLTDVPLSAAGLATVQSWRVPEPYRDFTWVASPLIRAQETARLLGLTCAVEPRICEMNWGQWEGRTREELIRDYGEEFHSRAAKGLDLRPHGGESPREVRDRFAAWIASHANGEELQHRRGDPSGHHPRRAVARHRLGDDRQAAGAHGLGCGACVRRGR